MSYARRLIISLVDDLIDQRWAQYDQMQCYIVRERILIEIEELEGIRDGLKLSSAKD